MKTTNFRQKAREATALLLTATAIFAASCGGSGSGSGGGKGVDVPAYATGHGAYFANRETSTAHAFWGKASANYGHKKFGSYDGRMMDGTLVELGGEEDGVAVAMLQTSSNVSISTYMFKEDYKYSVHLLWNEFEGEENPINATMAANLRGMSYTPLENNYCTSFYFYEDEALADAAAWLAALDKQPNQKSKYDAKAEGGVKTYKAVIGKVVRYVGQNEMKGDFFFSTYLDCGAVVEFRPKEGGLRLDPNEAVGKTLDCVTDADNKVIAYELS